MGLFDFFKKKSNSKSQSKKVESKQSKKTVTDNVFNSLQYQKEMTAFAQMTYFENNHDYSIVTSKLIKEGLNQLQADKIIENLKRVNASMVENFQNDLDTGQIAEIKIEPNPEHKRGNVTKEQIDKYIGYGAYQMEQGNLENALELFDKAIELDDKAVLAYANKGSLYSQKGDNEKAVYFYNKALEFDPKNIQILENKMDIMYEMLSVNNDEEAFIKSVKSCLEVDAKSPNALIYIIQYYLKQNDIGNALKSLKILFADYYSEQIAIQLLLKTFNLINDKEKALIEFDKLEKGFDDNAKYQLGYSKGLYLKGIRDYDNAIRIFEELNKQNDFSWNYYQVAIIKNIQGRETESLEYLKKTFALEPQLKQDARQYPELQNLWNNPKFIKITE
jgi:tetratricopeptide (TPR) repeat protein